jgi:hypothetical protein
MIRATNGRIRGQNEARSPIVYSCSPRAVDSRPCRMVLRDHCRNCSVHLIPPHSTALFRLTSVNWNREKVGLKRGIWHLGRRIFKTR